MSGRDFCELKEVGLNEEQPNPGSPGPQLLGVEGVGLNEGQSWESKEVGVTLRELAPRDGTITTWAEVRDTPHGHAHRGVFMNSMMKTLKIPKIKKEGE